MITPDIRMLTIHRMLGMSGNVGKHVPDRNPMYQQVIQLLLGREL
jgi:hypothetical protein